MPTGPLPPEAWLLESVWGRDIAHYANDEDDRISVGEEIEWAGIDVTPHSIVTMSLVKNAKAISNGAKTTRDKLSTYRKVGGEGMIAMGLTSYVAEGRRSFSFGKGEIEEFLAAPDPVVGDLIMGDGKTFYVALPEPIGKTTEGFELDGFLIVPGVRQEYDEEDDEEYPEETLFIFPMSRQLPDQKQYSLYPAHRVPMTDPARRVEDCLLDWSENYKGWYDIMERGWRQERSGIDDEEARVFADSGEIEQIKASVTEAQEQVLQEMRALAKESERHMTENASKWAKIVAGAMRMIHDPDSVSVPTYPAGAPANLVAKALSKGTGHRKAEQRLASSGYRCVHHLEKNENGAWPIPMESKQPDSSADKKTTPHVEGNQGEKPKTRIDRRKQKRRARTPIMQVTPVVNSTGSKTHKESGDKSTERVVAEPAMILPGANESHGVRTGADVDKDIEELERRCLRDAPDPGTRNWRNAMSSAFAGLITRRVKVAAMPRETPEAMRKRLAVGISDRICGLDATQDKIDAAIQNIGSTAYQMDTVSVLRAIDPDVPSGEGAVHRLLISGSDPLANHISFPGVDPGHGHEHAEDCQVLLRMMREGDELHIEGYAYEGCLIGYRKVILDLTDGRVSEADSQSDADDAEEYADRAYAALCDAILGPVDQIDAWRWEIEHERYRNKTTSIEDAPVASETEEKQDPLVVEPRFDILTTKAKTPVKTTFHSWDNLTQERDSPDMDDDDIAALRQASSSNAVSANLARIIRLDAAAPDGVMKAWRRYACSIVRSVDPVFTKVDSPRIRDNADLQEHVDTEGVIVLKDSTFLDTAHDNLINGGEAAKTRAFCIYYRVHLDGFSALVLQDDGADRLSFASWTKAPLHADAEDGELAWYLRGTIREALRTDAADENAAVVTTLPAMERKSPRTAPGFRQGAKRIIAQARMRPASMAIALRAVSDWFDEQVEKHGDNLVSDLREQGDWTIEHLSVDRGVESLWSVSVLTPESDPNCIDIVLQTTLATGVKPRLPTIIRRIAASTPTEGPDGLLRVRPSYIVTKGDVLDLVRDLQSPDRTLPILVMTQDDHGGYLKDPAEVAQQGMGALTVKTISQNMTYELTDRLGQEYRTFGGAARLFQPGFDPDRDMASRHPRIMPDTMADRAIASLISRATSATVTRYDIPEALRLARMHPSPPPSDLVRSDAKATIPLAPTETPQLEVPKEIVFEDPPKAAEKYPTNQVEEKNARAAEEEAVNIDDLSSRPADADANQEAVAPVNEPRSSPDTGAKAKTPQASEEATPSLPSPVIGVTAEQLEDIIGRALDTRIAALGLASLRDDLAAAMASDAFAPQSLLDEKEQEIQALRDELRIERETSVQLLDEADAERRSALLEVDGLRKALNDRRRASSKQAQPEYPEDLSGLADWLEHNVLPNVVITSKAWRSMRNVDYRDMERLCETLKLLDGTYIDMRAGEDGAREAWQEGLQRLRLEDKKQTRMGRAAREGDYQFTHEGETWVVERHLRGNESLHNDHSRLLRIYYTYDADRARVLICSMPRHAHTRDS